ncbi:MAG: DUF1285 domain-containing protein [Proteobacteria bacterium]|nr:DUF1285 domain-containing protein [Pseudomonadota bacterium]
MTNDIPPCNIRIDKEGVWYYNGAEMFRKEILDIFYQNLKRDESGRYIIELENDRCYLDVEDTPFVVKAVYRLGSKDDGSEAIHILLNDRTEEEIDPGTLWIEKDNVLYCSVKNNQFYARFSRAGYYQIVNYIEHDSEKGEYFISLNGRNYYISLRHKGTK